MKKVLVIEDERDIAQLISLHITDLDCQVKQVFGGDEGLICAESCAYDLIILDIMLPGRNGVDICRELRAKNVYTPIIMLTAMSEDVDKIVGLETGADDYITKPFSVRELTARVKAIFRRDEFNQKLQDHNTPLFLGEMSIYPHKRQVMISGEEVNLTPKEFELLLYLSAHPGRSYSRSELLAHVWGYEFEGYEHTVNSHINRLRSKIEPDHNNPRYILTTWGVGYRFTDKM